MNARPGLTRTEAVVVLLIVGVAGGLVAMGVVRVRDAAACMECQNNLKQHGIAVHGYVDAYEHLPPLVDQGEGAPTGRGLPSVFATLMPFLEATPATFRPQRSADYYHAHSSVEITYNGMDMPITHHGGMANYPFRTFQDPADRTAPNLIDIPMTLPDGSTGYYATGSYAANGLVPWGTGTMKASFPAGTADTILVGERPQVCRTADGDEVYNLWGLGFYSPHLPAFAALTPADPAGLASTGQAAPALPLPAEDDADTLRVRIGRRDAPPVPPDFATPLQVVRPGRPCDPRLPGTPHRRGMQVTMADGSVRVFAPAIDPLVFWAACVPDRKGGPVNE